MNPDEFIPVNGALNLKPSFGPIPADQLVPWTVIVLFNLVLLNRIFGIGWIPTILSTCWMVGTWWVLTGSDAARFLSKFHSPPQWTYGQLPYFTPLEPYPDLNETRAEKRLSKRRRKDRQKRRKSPTKKLRINHDI